MCMCSLGELLTRSTSMRAPFSIHTPAKAPKTTALHISVQYLIRTRSQIAINSVMSDIVRILRFRDAIAAVADNTSIISLTRRCYILTFHAWCQREIEDSVVPMGVAEHGDENMAKRKTALFLTIACRRSTGNTVQPSHQLVLQQRNDHTAHCGVPPPQK